MAVKDAELQQWLRGKLTYTSPECQNELLDIMARTVLRQITQQIRESQFYTIMIDESPDQSNKEQVVFCIRWVDELLDAHEHFLGFYAVNRTDAESLTRTIKDILMRLQLPLDHCRGQCYDGASVMKGEKSGVATRLMKENPKALYVHCYAHSLNLAVQDATKQCSIMRDALDVTNELTKLVKRSPKRESWLEQLKEQLPSDVPNPGKLQKFSFTRWTVRAKSIRSLLENFLPLQTLLAQLLEESDASDLRTKICGLQSQMEKYQLLFGLMLAELVYGITDKLSTAIQSEKMSATDARSKAMDVVRMLNNLRGDFTSFKAGVDEKSHEFGVDGPQLPRQRKAPRRLDSNTDNTTQFKDTESYLRHLYYEVVDSVSGCISNRFKQQGMATHIHMEEVVFKSIAGADVETHVAAIKTVYTEDFDYPELNAELRMLRHGNHQFETVTQFIAWTKSNISLYPQLTHLSKLLLLMLSSNAVSERSFSAMGRVKTAIRAAMGQCRLNSLVLLHVHNQLTDQLSHAPIVEEFIAGHSRRGLYLKA